MNGNRESHSLLNRTVYIATMSSPPITTMIRNTYWKRREAFYNEDRQMNFENVRDRVGIATLELNHSSPGDPWWRPMHRQRSAHNQYDGTTEPNVSHARARRTIHADHVCTRPRCHSLEKRRPIAKIQFPQQLKFKCIHGSLDSNNRSCPVEHELFIIDHSSLSGQNKFFPHRSSVSSKKDIRSYPDY